MYIVQRGIGLCTLPALIQNLISSAFSVVGYWWNHRSRDHRTQRGHFPIGGQWWPCTYLARIQRYGASKILGSRVWLFGVTWRHRSRDHRTRRGTFLLVVNDDHASILHRYGDTGFKVFVVMSLTFWGHATSSVTWPLDSAYVVFYWWSIGTMRLSCTVKKI